jgi:hypothetical protein
MTKPHTPEPGSPERIEAQVEADEECDPRAFDDMEEAWDDAQEEAWDEAQAEERRQFDAAVEKVRDGLKGLHKLGKVDFLRSIAEWINKKYRPPPKPRGHKPNRLRTDPAFARVFWEWFTTPPHGGKQAILKREYKNLGFSEWEYLQDKFATHKASLSDYEKQTGPVSLYFSPLDDP